MIRIENINKTFGKKVVLHDVNLTCDKGELITLLGVNGAGKSTLLNIVSGFLKPDLGKVIFDENDIFRNYYKHKKDSGYMLEEPYYLEKLSASEFLTFMGNLYSIPNNELRNSISYYLKLLNVPNDKSRIETLSQGTKKKLSFITAIINNPKFLILDEPFIGMDIESVKKCKVIIQEIKSNNGSILLSSNQPERVKDITDIFTIINKGKVVFQGSTEKIEEVAKNTGNQDTDYFNQYISSLMTDEIQTVS